MTKRYYHLNEDSAAQALARISWWINITDTVWIGLENFFKFPLAFCIWLWYTCGVFQGKE
jgi:hypothetical protein